MIITKCNIEKNSHIRSTELVCLECNQTVCSKCISEHPKHQIIDQDDIEKEMFSERDNVLPFLIQDRNKQKQYNQDKFNILVEATYKSQLEAIHKHFEKLHTQINEKEESLKKDLKASNQRNLLKFNRLNSDIEKELEWAKEFIEALSNTSEEQDKEKLIKFSLLGEYLMTHYNDLALVDYYQEGFREKTTPEEIFECINSASLVLNKTSVIKEQKSTKNTLYSFNQEEGVEIYNFNTSKLLSILPYQSLSKDNLNAPNDLNINFLFQNATTNDYSIYLFSGDKYWTFQGNSHILPVWKSGNISNSLIKVSTMLDKGRNTIFIFGGKDSKTLETSRKVSRFNIISQRFEEIGDILPDENGLTDIHLSADPENLTIYLIGGINGKGQYSNTIYKFHTLSYKIEKVIEFPNSLIGDIIGGCFSDVHKTFYLLSYDGRFHSYSLKTKEITSLSQDKEMTETVKFLFDGEDKIYVQNDYSLFECCLFIYTISNGKWNQITYPFSSLSYLSLIKT